MSATRDRSRVRSPCAQSRRHRRRHTVHVVPDDLAVDDAQVHAPARPYSPAAARVPAAGDRQAVDGDVDPVAPDVERASLLSRTSGIRVENDVAPADKAQVVGDYRQRVAKRDAVDVVRKARSGPGPRGELARSIASRSERSSLGTCHHSPCLVDTVTTKVAIDRPPRTADNAIVSREVAPDALPLDSMRRGDGGCARAGEGLHAAHPFHLRPAAVGLDAARGAAAAEPALRRGDDRAGRRPGHDAARTP